MNKQDKLAEFENEYHLSSFNKNWFKRISQEDYDQKNKVLAFSEKPTKVWKDIIKRFFSNKWNIIFLSILFALIMLIILGPLFSKFSDNVPVSNASTSQVKYLSPFSGGRTTFSGSLGNIQGDVDGSIVFNPTLGTLTSPRVTIISSSFNSGIWTITYINPHYVQTILGTDSIGVSIWQRLMSSARFSISLSLIVASIETIIGTAIGLYLGYHAGKWIDTYFMRLVEIISSIPAILLTVIIVLIIGNSFWAFVFALVAIGWIGPVYVTRMFTMKIKDREFIKASISVGSSKNRIIFRHVLPTIIGRLLVSFVHRIPLVIFIEATFVFLGISLGGDAKNTLGHMFQEGRLLEAIHKNPIFLISTASLLLLFTISLQIIANGIRDAFDAKVIG